MIVADSASLFFQFGFGFASAPAGSGNSLWTRSDRSVIRISTRKWGLQNANVRRVRELEKFAGAIIAVASCLPQLRPRSSNVILQFLIFGTISVILNTAADLLVVGFAGSLAARLARRPNLIERQRTLSGAGMIGLGIYVAASK